MTGRVRRTVRHAAQRVGSKINNAGPSWTGTLRGEAAELYARYEQELRPTAFTMASRVANHPNGMLGDVTPFLIWLD